jgi:chemotaxis protein histidine kinase CheA
MQAATTGAPGRQLSAMLARLKLERAPVRLRRIGDQARSLAQRLGKTSLRIEVQAQGDVRFDRARWASFWAAFIHPLRNAIDHGIESAEARSAAGLPHATEAELLDALFADGITTADHATELSGRGVGMGALRAAAQALGGTVVLQSRRGQGTTLRVRVPVT